MWRKGFPPCALPSVSLLLLSAGCAATRPARFPDGEGLVRRVVDEGLGHGRAWDMLGELCTTAPHRLAGSPGSADAVQWAAEAMRAAGLEHVHLEPCTVPHWERGDVEELTVLAPPELVGQSLPILALGGSVATPPEGVEGEVVVVHDFDELERLGGGAAGRIVLFDRPLDDLQRDPFDAYGGAVDQRSRGAVETARAGGVATLVRSMTTRRDDVAHTGAMHYADGVARVPAAAVSTLAADRIAGLVAAGTPVRVRLRLACRTLDDAPSFDVVGDLPGTERPDEIVLLGAHIDDWDVGQGAHDDGSGCVQVIEAARLLGALGLRPRRTIRVVLFMNEENGLAGARAYAAAHADQLGQHVLALESDRGGFTPRGFTTAATGDALALLRAAAAPLAEIGADRVQPGEGGADIGVLRPAGTLLVGYLPDPQRYFDYHHSRRDTLEAVDPRELELGATAIACLAFRVADLDAPLPRKPPSE